MTTLFDISGIQARIHHLPGRQPFILSADLAEVYGTSVKAINQAVKRNGDLFPEDFAFRLTAAEEDAMWSQIVTTSARKRDDFQTLVFTHAGANGLSAVLKTPIARKMHVTVHRAFAAMEQAALADARNMVARLQVEALRKKPIFGFIELSMQRGQSIQQMWKQSNYPLWKLEQAARDMLAMRMIDRLPAGMQPGLFDA